MLKFEVDDLKDILKDYDAVEDLNAAIVKANELNDIIYPEGYKGVIENPIVTYINECAEFYRLVEEHYILDDAIAELEDKKKNASTPEEIANIDDQIKEKKDNLDQLAVKAGKHQHILSDTVDNIIATIDEMPQKEKQEEATNSFDAIVESFGKIKNKLANGKTENKGKPKEKDPEEMTREELIEEIKKARAERDAEKARNEEIMRRLDALENKQNSSILSKLKNGFKTVKKKVVAAKDYVVGFAKEHKKVTAAILLALAAAGIIGSCVVYHTPFAIPARIASAMWKPLHNIGLGAPLHTINEFLLKILPPGSGVFNSVSGVWTIGNASVKNLNMLECVLGNMVGAGILAGAGYGLFKGGKRIVNWAKKKKKTKEPEDNKMDDFEEYVNALSDEQLSELINQLEEALEAEALPEQFKDYTLDDLEEMYDIATRAENYRTEDFSEFEDLRKRQLNKALNKLNKIIDNWGPETEPTEIKINGEYYEINTKEEALELWNKLDLVYEKNYGGKTR